MNTEMLKTIEPKSSQLNYDDFIEGQTKTIKITKVSLAAGDQPVAIHYENDNGKPYMPGKSMRRVLVNCWGSDATKYVGRSLTLYGDPKVVFGGQAVGGIRISHLSHITEPVTMALTASRASRKPFTVKPLEVEGISAPQAKDGALIVDLTKTAKKGMAALEAEFKALPNETRRLLKPFMSDLKTIAAEADNKVKPAEELF